MKLTHILTATAASTFLFAATVGGTLVFAQLLATPAAAGPGDQKTHKQSHINAHNLLGENLHHDGKHDIAKFSGRTVTAEVKGGKVVNMMAGDLKVTKVKSKQKMATAVSGFLKAAYVPGVQLAQYQETTTYYDYGYCVDDGYETTCYWYPPSDVVTTDPSYVDYSSYTPY